MGTKQYNHKIRNVKAPTIVDGHIQCLHIRTLVWASGENNIDGPYTVRFEYKDGRDAFVWTRTENPPSIDYVHEEALVATARAADHVADTYDADVDTESIARD